MLSCDYRARLGPLLSPALNQERFIRLLRMSVSNRYIKTQDPPDNQCRTRTTLLLGSNVNSKIISEML